MINLKKVEIYLIGLLIFNISNQIKCDNPCHSGEAYINGKCIRGCVSADRDCRPGQYCAPYPGSPVSICQPLSLD